MNLKDFFAGQAFDACDYFGAHPDVEGYAFRTYAPNARGVGIIGDFNGWQEQPMKPLYDSGIWVAYVREARPGQIYKYCVYGADGRREHCDPYGFGMELRPGSGSVVRDLGEYRFTDEAWLSARTRGISGPVNIYELHLGSWQRNGHDAGSYCGIADPLISYLKTHGYNYVEFMPLSEHPFDGSWGYQNTGFFAPTSRYGSAAQLMALIDRLHHAGIGVIMDFVPVHFAVDDYGLARYDGTALYEYPDREDGESEWGSYNFNHARGEVASFLMSAADYWLTRYHVDGLRMDAVSRLIYRHGDESRGENGPAIAFLRRMNRGLRARHPSAMLIAEDSTAYPGVTKTVEDGGLGFDYKWDLGWMHDTLRYMGLPPRQRPDHPRLITFSMYYAYNERYILPFSHDEVVHEKRTIIDKLYGDYDEKFAQLRLLYFYMFTHPGKKLNFMGNEIAMFREWDERRTPDWNLLEYPAHRDFHGFMAALCDIYLAESALWERDHVPEGVQWIDRLSDNAGVFGFFRVSGRGRLLVLLNFTDVPAELCAPLPGRCKLLLSTCGCCGALATDSLPEALPPFTGLLYRVE